MGAEGKSSSLKEDQTEKRNCNEKCDAIGEFNGPCGDFYKNMFGKCPAGRPGTTDKVPHDTEKYGEEGVCGFRFCWPWQGLDLV